MGLADRYEDIDGGNLGGGYFIHSGYEKDLMSNGRTNSKLDNSYYKHYVGMYGGASPNLKVANVKFKLARVKTSMEE